MNFWPFILIVSSGVLLGAFGDYINPVVNVDAPDPGVLFYDGLFWMVSTSGDDTSNMFPIRKSADLVSWTSIGFVFNSSTKPSWASKCFWAPELHVVGGRIMVYFVACDSAGLLSIGGGYASHPQGPYTALEYRLVNDPLGAIDPSFFKDPVSGHQYLLWKVNDAAASIYAQETNDAGDSLLGSKTLLMVVSLTWEQPIVEAPWMIYRNNTYYMFYSSGYYNQPTYNIGVARSSSPLGPFEKACAPLMSQYADGSPSNAFSAPGHTSVLDYVGESSSTFLVYHSWYSGKIDMSPGRVVLVDQLWWSETPGDWPVVSGQSGTPTCDSQPTPTSSGSARVPSSVLQIGNSYTLQTYQWSDQCWSDDGVISTSGCSCQYKVHSGLCSGMTITLESVNKPGYYWRHKNGQLTLDKDDGTDLFHQDSSFMPLAGLHNQDYVSFRSVNYPSEYIRHKDGILYINEWDGTDLMAQDASFLPIAK
ncbi:family 43 glycosylhydrolase [Pelomyxa schiedti]|nr:family 43 glycosylhydrolase [Pelomyxa schiedti]